MNIGFNKREQFTRAEREGVQWLVGRNTRWLETTVNRGSPKEFDLRVKAKVLGGFVVAGWFVNFALREFVSMGLTPAHGYTDQTDPTVSWSHFDRVLAWATAAQAHPRLEFTDNLITCVYQCWGEISPDAGRCSNAEAIEMVCDADRLCYLGPKGKAANDELQRLDTRFGYDQVSKALARKVKLV